jgi:hypothetical protein
MTPRLKLALTFAGLIGCATIAGAQRAPYAGSFGFCAPPAPPPCSNSEDTFAKQTALDACTVEFRRYINSVLIYRTCVNRELTRFIEEANAASDRFGCRSAGRAKCR